MLTIIGSVSVLGSIIYVGYLLFCELKKYKVRSIEAKITSRIQQIIANTNKDNTSTAFAIFISVVINSYVVATLKDDIISVDFTESKGDQRASVTFDDNKCLEIGADFVYSVHEHDERKVIFTMNKDIGIDNVPEIINVLNNRNL